MCDFYGVAHPPLISTSPDRSNLSHKDSSAGKAHVFAESSAESPLLVLARTSRKQDVRWWAAAYADHNHLRITRILRSLRLFGLEKEAEAFHAEVVSMASAGVVGQRSLRYWERAVREPIFQTLR